MRKFIRETIEETILTSGSAKTASTFFSTLFAKSTNNVCRTYSPTTIFAPGDREEPAVFEDDSLDDSQGKAISKNKT